ncbi:unnamed protein product [Allacma fusca]|uniref:Uncharacterized protein n=1 Tax=Allacma fusca TaxID=39272 RepID=A0A8J2M9C5_9HEXA|nr:unnamed protein product [Allacma fusca]
MALQLTISYLLLILAILELSNGQNDWQIGPFIKDDAVNPFMGPRNDTRFACPVRKETIAWEAKDVFNPTAIVQNNVVKLFYRAEDYEGAYKGTSRIGLAISSDGLNFTRITSPIFFPDNDTSLIYEWEGGCEDPRITLNENGTYFMTYTAYNGSLARLMHPQIIQILHSGQNTAQFSKMLMGEDLLTSGQNLARLCQQLLMSP